MPLSRGETIALVAGFGAVILTAIIHIGIREWYQPDLRYEEGTYYVSGDLAITSLRVTNAGHSDAEEIVISAKFSSGIRDVSLNAPGLQFVPTVGGVGERRVTGTVKRLVPGQTVSIYFAVEHDRSLGQEHQIGFLESITFKGGQGKTGQPVWGARTLGAIAITIIYVGMILFMLAYMRRQREPHYEGISKMISAAQEAKKSGQSRDEFLAVVEAELKGVKYRTKTLKEVALRVFDAS